MAGRPKTRTEENFLLTAEIIGLIHKESKKTTSDLAKILGVGDVDGKSLSVYKCGNQSLSPEKMKDILLAGYDYGWINSADIENFAVRLQCLGVKSNLLDIVLTKDHEQRQSRLGNCHDTLIETDELVGLPQLFEDELARVEALLEQASREAALTGLALGDVLHKVTGYYNNTLEDAI